MNRLKEIRKAMGMTQKEFGELLGVTKTYIYMLETGRKRPSKLFEKFLDCIEEKYLKGGEK